LGCTRAESHPPRSLPRELGAQLRAAGKGEPRTPPPPALDYFSPRSPSPSEPLKKSGGLGGQEGVQAARGARFGHSGQLQGAELQQVGRPGKAAVAAKKVLAPGVKTRTKDKYRVVYTDHQRLELEKEFHYSRYITIRRKAELAATLGLSERQVKIWFQNRRAKERKINKKKLQQQQQQQQPPQQPQQPPPAPQPAQPQPGPLRSVPEPLSPVSSLQGSVPGSVPGVLGPTGGVLNPTVTQ
uniref:Caudal type homeobox 2 n=1 Tax=Equus caballus TaxID=9796 RepID=A0A9L0SJJ8_HORSE